MNQDLKSQDRNSQLRHRAEERLQAKGFLQGIPPSPGELTEDELLNLIHELNVHQIELEMQNEALHQAQEELAATRDRYFALFDLAPVGYFMLDEETVILDVNLAGTELLGVKRSELNGKKLISFIYEQDQDIFYLLNRQIHQTRAQADRELRLVKPGGDLFYAQLTCALVNEPGSKVEQLRIILKDINELKTNERSLKLYATRLEILNRDLESFTFIASHDLQEPLRKILKFGELIKAHANQHADEEVRKYIDRMQNAAVRMQALISDLLAYSRVANNLISFQTIDLNQIVLEVLDDLEARIERSGAHVEVGDLPHLSGEPILMRQLFQNLIGNALKFHAPEKPPVVRIEASRLTPEMVEIRVIDQGIGFDEQYSENIFLPFERIHGRSQYEGSGIGLAICRKIVERHSGSITARSREKEGATFIVTLPVQHV